MLEILNGLGSSKAPITSVGLIPTGSGNAICSCIGWLDPLMSTLRLAEGFFQPLDIFQASSLKMNPNGRIESDSRLGMVVAGWGFFSEVDFNSERWRWMGELRFTFLAIQKIIQGSRYPCQVFYRPHSLEISSQAHYSDPSDFFFSVSDLSVPPGWQILDGRSGEIRYLCISNGEFISQSTRNSPGANLLDGQLWICAVSSQGRISFAKTLLKMDTGNHSDVSGVKIIPAKEILVIPENPEIPMDIDGEQRPSLPTLLQVLPWKARLCC